MDLRRLGLGLGAFAAGAAAWTFGAARYGDKAARLLARGAARVKDAGPAGAAETENGVRERPGTPAAEHVPTDLLADAPVSAATRAPEAFRPDPTAVPSPEERESLRPATGPAPTLAADRGSGFSEAAGAA